MGAFICGSHWRLLKQEFGRKTPRVAVAYGCNRVGTAAPDGYDIASARTGTLPTIRHLQEAADTTASQRLHARHAVFRAAMVLEARTGLAASTIPEFRGVLKANGRQDAI